MTYFGITARIAVLLASPLSLSKLALASEGVIPIHEIREPTPPSEITKYNKVAVVQWNPSAPTPLGVSKEAAERFKDSNRDVLEKYIREAAKKGAKMILTPEFSIVGYPDIPELPPEEDEFRDRADIAPYVETVPGPSTERFAKLAKELHVYIHIGFAEVDTKDSKYYNTVVALDPKGEIVAKYHKINLYQGENNFLSPGTTISTYESPWGTVGLTICADIYSSHPMNSLKKAGAQVIALSTSWAVYNSGFDTFTQTATQYGFYVLAANQSYFPDSGVINPDGKAQSHIRQSDGLAYGYLPIDSSQRPR